ncbi:MAG: arginine--tRNA ligase [Pseudomonadota bacterium]
MNIYQHFASQIHKVLQEQSDLGHLPGMPATFDVKVEPPRDASHGDLATNIAMVLAKPAKMPPRAIAERLVEPLSALDDISAVEIAGPGFLNLRLTHAFWQRQIGAILRAGTDFGRSKIGAGTPVNVEFVSANPTGPLHMGHCRGAVYGDALTRLLSFSGYKVVGEYYINDAGSQVDVLARSVHLRYREALGETVGDIPEGLYPGDYLVPVGEALAKRYGTQYQNAEEAEWLPRFRRDAVDAMMDLVRSDLKKLGIAHDVFFSEQTLHNSNAVAETVNQMRADGLIYDGILDPPKGKKPDDWEPRKQALFRATDFGDDVDRPLQKSDGAYTYFAADIAYHKDKYARGFADMINVWGADHGGYVKRMRAAVHAFSGQKAELDIKVCQMVKLLRDGEPVKMSKRSGQFITLADVVDEVGKDVVRFIMLTRKNDAPLEFDFSKVAEQSKDNPVFYVQYAHARVSSVLRKSQENFPNEEFTTESLANVDLSGIVAEEDFKLIREMSEWPRVVEAAALAHEPHRIAFYLNDLAATFHALWNRGNETTALRFFDPDNVEVTRVRMALIMALQQVLANGLTLMGVTPAQEM